MTTRREQLLQKFAQKGVLTGDEDFELCETRQDETGASKPIISDAQIERLVNDKVAKALQKPVERPVERAARELLSLIKKSKGAISFTSPHAERAHKSLSKAHRHFSKAAERYRFSRNGDEMDDSDLDKGNAYLAQGIGHLERGDLNNCAKAMKAAGEHYERVAGRLADDDDIQNGHAHFIRGLQHLSKIDFEGRQPQGSGLEPRNPAADTNLPTKAAKQSYGRRSWVGRKIADPAFAVGTALMKAAQESPMSLNPARAERDIPSIPGALRGLEDVGGDLFGDEARARAGDVRAQQALIQRAMKPAIITSRY